MSVIKIIRISILMMVAIHFFLPLLVAQQVVTGRITDAEDGTPVPGASIFIANTTVGATSDASGNYSFTVPGRGSFEIVVSHVGYQSVFQKIDTPQSSHQYDVPLESNEMQEVTITAAKRYRQRDVDLFWRTILGEKPSKNRMEVLNPEKVYFYLNSDNVLKVTCNEAIEIINHQTGYHIRYMLQSFQHDYRNRVTSFYGQPHFEELISQNNRQKNLWEKKQQEIYAVSIRRFMRALYREQIHEEGFLLINRDSLWNRKKTPVILKDIIQADQDMVIVNIKEPLFLMCFSEPVTSQMIENSYSILVNRAPYPVIAVLKPQQIRIYPDGTYTGLLEIGEYRNSIIGLSSMLPVEYGFLLSGFNQLTTLSETEKYVKSEADFYLNAEENLMAQLKVYPQEKIHLHTDRDFYVPGEKIWFKAYVVDAHSHLFPTYSEYVYVELISPADTLVNKVMVRQIDDMFYGHLPLTELVPEGDYTLRAYTRYMENQGDDYFFKKNIRIEKLNSAKNQQQQIAQTSRNRRGQTEKEDFDVSFFPEGGNLLEGVFCKVAFKAINKNGYPEMVSGKIADENGVELASVETYYAGMGVFTFQPVLGKRFYLKCKNGNGVEKQFELPQPNPRSYSLTATWRSQRLIVGVQKSNHATKIPCYLLVHCRGTVLYFEEWDNRQDFISLMEENLPAGVIQVVLFDGQMNPLSERLVFSKNDASANVEFHTDKDVYEKRDKVIASISLPDSISYSFGSHFSIAVTDDQDIAVDESTTILSSLLLSSELKGYIENPAYYLQDNFAMDLLMMTHGWRRYNIPEVVKGNTEYPQKPFQQAQEISGSVKSRIFNNLVPDGEVLIMMKGGGIVVTTTDENGSFKVQDLEFPDSTTFYVRALDRNGRDNVKPVMDNELFPELIYAPQSPVIQIISETGTEIKDEFAFIEKAEQRAKFDEDIWTMHIEEVAITAPRIKTAFDDPRLLFWANQSSDATITRDQIEQHKHVYVSDYLWLTSGVRVSPNGAISIRGERGLPAVFIDGVEQAWPDILMHPTQSPLERVAISAIESIDVFKGFGAAAFGVRGANGVISITTRRGGNTGVQTPKFNYSDYTPLGYQKPAEFYAPKYETLEVKHSGIPDLRTTIFWKPDIVITEDGKVSFEFYTSDFRTTYSVVIEGITSDGRIVREVKKIRVE